MFKNTPWGRVIPSLIEKTTVPCVRWRKEFFKKMWQKNLKSKLLNNGYSMTVIMWKWISHTLVCVLLSAVNWRACEVIYKFCSISSGIVWFLTTTERTTTIFFSVLVVSFYEVNNILFGETKIHNIFTNLKWVFWEWWLSCAYWKSYKNEEGKKIRGTNMFLMTCLSHKSPFSSLLKW